MRQYTTGSEHRIGTPTMISTLRMFPERVRRMHLSLSAYRSTMPPTRIGKGRGKQASCATHKTTEKCLVSDKTAGNYWPMGGVLGSSANVVQKGTEQLHGEHPSIHKVPRFNPAESYRTSRISGGEKNTSRILRNTPFLLIFNLQLSL